ncbi:signal transduction histidine kinase/DNA-binding response OmpR family regulator/ligand-binding sensor domain-containing protein [Pedobacter sp. UYP30]|uniref:hybrid sensor histidine kinase/response regulator transcription factor n=1 Tax=Pedobacter sp. UYP30 TaxID=1756400 RepID=UPI00339195DE
MNHVNSIFFNIKTTFFLCFFLTIAFILSSIGAKAQSFPFKFNYLTVDDGLSHTDANDIAQDSKGFIWIATFFGLDRYDGYTIKKFYNSNEPVNNAFKNRINCIFPEADGNIWLGTEAGLQCFDSKTEKYIDYVSNGKEQPIFDKIYKLSGNVLVGRTENKIRLFNLNNRAIVEKSVKVPNGFECTSITQNNNGVVFVTSNLGLWTLDIRGNLTSVSITGTPSSVFTYAYFDKSNNLILASNDKLFVTKRDGEGKTFKVTAQVRIPAPGKIKGILKDNMSNLWLSTSSSLLRLDSNLKIIQIIKNRDSPHSLNSNTIDKIFIDRSDCFWVCTFGGGVNYFDLNEKLFYTLRHSAENQNSLSGNHIRSILANGNDLWIGTTANGLNLYNFKTESFGHYKISNTQLKLKSDEITALTLDNDKNLWIGSASGIEILKANKTDLWKPTGSENFPNHVIDCITKDYYGNIWFGNHVDKFGVIWKDGQNQYHVKYYGLGGFFIFADKNKPQLLISSTQGLKRLIVDKSGNVVKQFLYKASSAANSLSSNYTYPIVKQNDSTYWIGTIGGGLNNLLLKANNRYDIKIFGQEHGVFNDVESMEIDDADNIWMGGNGLQKLSIKTGKLTRYDKNDGLQGNSFKVNASYKDADGRLYFGGINGLNYFQPSEIISNKILPEPTITDILINNRSPHYGTSNNDSLSQAITYSKKIALNYLQNNFVVFFSAMHYANPLKCKYRYKLIGFDKEWKYTDGKNPSAAYNNLDNDTYKFVVQASNNDDVWSKVTKEITFEIIPPWWKSNFAKIVYFLLIFSILVSIYIYQGRWHRLKREIEVRALNEEKREEMHLQKEELYQQQLMFFTNISHEFRTPLTLILGPLESLINENKDSHLNNSYQLMLKNAKRLINLISELMNFKKVADSVIKLQIQELSVSRFCQEVAAEFQHLATVKNIGFTVTDYTKENANKEIIGWFDSQILEKILFNLLNNSFKYTDNGGNVSFDIATDINQLKSSFLNGFKILNENFQADNYIYFRVADSGIGISEESLTQIFERYYRISKNHLGSGVGLALVKSLTLMHKGNIYVRSERFKGTEIIIAIPWGQNFYTETEKAAAKNEFQTQLEPIDNSVQLPLVDFLEQRSLQPSNGKKSILLVDDNQELRNFLTQILSPYYNIVQAEDGSAAVEMAKDKIPDLIISDVMMPKMNGIEFCRIIKEAFETRHVPFIILSAKDALESKIEGMESGADYYFSKPLSSELLLLTINNIFLQREKLKEQYTNNYLSEATELVQTEKDKTFLSKLVDLIEENIQQQDLDVDFLCSHLFISRTKLYQKIKSISDQSVGEFIRTVRLKRAIQLMTHEDITMNEVADKVGLQSSSNFSRTFKRQYGKSPLQFMQALKNEKRID